LKHLKAKGYIDCAPSAQIPDYQAVQIQEIDAAALKNEIVADGGDKLGEIKEKCVYAFSGE
jgi:hypothetical protein